MRRVLLIIGMIVTIFSCQQNNNTTNTPSDPNVHKAIALEKINTNQYSYLLVNENGIEKWLAFPLVEVKIGETYYYVNEMLMNNFVSKELGRTFEKVYFILGLYTEPPIKVTEGNVINSNPQSLPQNHPQLMQQSEKTTNVPSESNPNMHKGIAFEKINTTQYTYLLVNENGLKNWLAFPLAEVKIGETYFYTNEMLMTNFESKELKRTFEKVYFIPGVFTEPPSKQMQGNAQSRNVQTIQQNNTYTGSTIDASEKLKIKIAPSKDGFSIADLIAKKENYAGEKVVIKGKVTKFSPEIMGKNWIHIQDGSEYKGSFDLTITSQNFVKVGETITFEGTISINKDFGGGYHYDVLLEDAIVK